VDQATALITAAISKIFWLIATAGILLLAAGLVGYVLAKRNPQWSRATKQLVHSALVFAAAVVWVAIFLAKMRSA